MAILSVQPISPSGLSPAFVAALASGDEFDNPDGRTFLIVKNGGASSITVTINSQRPCSYGFDHDLTINVPAGGERWIGPFDRERFNNANGRVQVTYSAVTSVTVAAVRV